MPKAFEIYNCLNFLVNFLEKQKVGIFFSLQFTILILLCTTLSQMVVCGQDIRSLKHCLTRDGMRKLTQKVLDKITFGINRQAQDDAGSAAERSFGKAPRTFLLNSLE